LNDFGEFWNGFEEFFEFERIVSESCVIRTWVEPKPTW